MKTTQLESRFLLRKATPQRSQNRMMKNYLPLLAFLFLSSFAINLSAQTTGDYRSIQDGEWNSRSTWQRFDGFDWFTPTGGQGVPKAEAGQITIQSGTSVTNTTGPALTVTTLTIESGGQLSIGSGRQFTVNDGTNENDLTINGTLSLAGTLVINGKCLIGTGGSLSGSATAQITVNGTMENQNTIDFNGLATAFLFNPGGSYDHAREGGIIPTATWDATSNCFLSGITENVPTGLNQTFGNFIWNSAGVTGDLPFGDAEMILLGNLEFRNTGTGQIAFNQEKLSVPGDLILSGGNLLLASMDVSRTFEVGANFSMSAGALAISDGSNSGILNIAGNFEHTGGTISHPVGTGANSEINFNGTALQTFTGGGIYSGPIDFNVLSGAILTFGALIDIVDLRGTSGDFTNFGTLMGHFLVDNTDGDDEGILLAEGKALINEGTVAPGNSVGTLVIVGDFISYGTLSMEIEDLFIYDQIIVTGTATINGTVAPEFIAYTPAIGNVFDLIAAPTFVTPPTPGLSITPASTVGNYNAPSGDLEITAVFPIQLLSFTGKRVDDVIELQWRTATEENNDYMAVERADHDFEFREIGRVAGVGTTTEAQDYEFIDESPLDGANYYRLRQVDIDGKVEYHPVIYVDFVAPSQSRALRAFPNPARDLIRASWASGQDEMAGLRLFNGHGQLIRSYRVNGANGTFELPLEDLAAGMYYLHLQQGSKREQLRFVKY
ncbi:T9SS type A sorting domain-containing protein [Flavilitoribacter nigricans]|uniref:Secretion system C-terminal sorting domain-containing protein n=1 Tax=Flavilitoribacter nigricans (strain ATCC 23147 / DSM 23189 / NBRC 102662 / NCIMB 1420 / SS-2) TaxID=1122177 RepID=A0A2D0N2S1_FLAN2|nr:T9SS type A sorting domain-containing protein [Flavilitoribacter nigricans]PHN02795.1 hypothetical protein CRP01_29880 [Flavilitoribacter nigricans DSM 23189 = NBRC 102662]